MIKGVNKQVVEMAETDSDYFEKVLFFVKPEFYGLSEGKLKEKAQKVLNGTGIPPRTRKNKNYALFTVLTAVGGVIMGAIITVIVFSVIK